MENEIEQRLDIIINNFNYRSLRQFCFKLNLSYQSLIDLKIGKKKQFSRNDIDILVKANINSLWLETGNGEMLLSDSKTSNSNFTNIRSGGLFNLPDINKMTIEEIENKYEELKPIYNYIIKLEKIIKINKED